MFPYCDIFFCKLFVKRDDEDESGNTQNRNCKYRRKVRDGESNLHTYDNH